MPKIVRTVWLALQLALLSAVLVACGGDGGGGSSTQPPVTSPPPDGSSTQPPVTSPPTESPDKPASLSISTAVPESAKRLIVNLSGSSGPQAFRSGSGQTTTTVSVEFPLVVATTNANEIVLASVQGGTAIELSASSTAIALTRLLLTLPPSGLSEAEAMLRIKTDPMLPQLVKTVESTLAGGIIPSKDAAVLRSAMVIAGNVIKKGLTSDANSLPQSTLKALADEKVKGDLPFKAISLPIGSVAITGGLVNVYNSTPIAWSAYSKDYKGQIIKEGNVSVQLLHGADLKTWLAAQLPGWLAPRGQSIPNDGDRAFDLIIEQDAQAKLVNMTDLLGSIVSEIAGADTLNGPGACTKELAEALFNKELLVLAEKKNGQAFVDYLISIGLDLSPLMVNLVNGSPRLCPGSSWVSSRERLTKRLVSLAARLNLLVSTYKIVDKTVSGGVLVGRLYWFVDNWNTSKPVRVCVKDGFVVNCAVRFAFPEPLVLLEGAQHKPELLAFDIDNNRTAVPASVRYFSENSGALTVDPITGMLKAGLRPAIVGLDIVDTVNVVSSKELVHIQTGELTPSSQTLFLDGGSGSVRLVSTFGKPIIASGVGLDWTILDSSVAQLLAGQGATAGLLMPKATGETTVFVNNLSSGARLGASVKVKRNANDFWEGTYDRTSCHAPRYSGSGDICAYVLKLVATSSGGQYGGPGTLFARIGSTEDNNIRIGHTNNVAMCSSASNIDIGSVDKWSITRTMFGPLLGQTQAVTIDFHVTNRTPALISGTFSGEFAYPVYDSKFNTVPQQGGRVTGVWQLKPRSAGLPNGGAFPKCITNGYDTCSAFGRASTDGRKDGVCDWKSHYDQSRPGEWLALQ